MRKYIHGKNIEMHRKNAVRGNERLKHGVGAIEMAPLQFCSLNRRLIASCNIFLKLQFFFF